MSVRIIPRLDTKGPNLVKGIHLEGLRVLGSPDRFARHYYEAGADELLYVDVVASLYGRNSLLPMIEKIAQEIFIPLNVGGGLRSLEDIRAALKAGADKVSLNTAAIRRPEFVREAAKRFGSSTIVVNIEAIRDAAGTYACFTDNGREATGVDAFQWAQEAERLGAGELLVTSVDREGTGEGFDLELTRRIAESVSIPVIASGGAGHVDHIRRAVLDGKADAIAIATTLHYGVPGQLPEHGVPGGEGNLEFLKSGRGFGLVQPTTIPEIKRALRAGHVDCRPAEEASAHA